LLGIPGNAKSCIVIDENLLNCSSIFGEREVGHYLTSHGRLATGEQLPIHNL
jgi:hypothetical protein